ncbi:kinesin-like protein KIF15 isoform X2 [Physella acuta]|uniref:kinesin-like protein KIF15 isoform X2 n=1 Tax=Physella acuta TaxID=109671 RepID=UPI0027DC2CEE|nr:kinesin-like protein KIF15 isoform X2 [Physella acuta]
MDTVSSTSTSSEGDSIKIFLRVRPPDPSISENDFAPRVLDVNTADNAVILRTKPEPKVFTYDNVADADITQEAVFSIVGKKIIESCVTGYNGTIFAYGQTGSGKTFTMLGPSENSDSFQHELRGVIPRSFEYLFSLIAHQQELHGSKKQFLCRCSFLEIYQEQIFDLLDPASQGLHLRENMNKGVFVDGLIEQVICNPSDAYQVLIMGWLNRRVAATSMNRESSRSHAVFTVMIESKEDAGGVQNIRTSQLNLVDLAGSERQKDTNTGGTRLKEAGSINKSLSVLGNVIMSLVDLSHGKKRHIPYRDSKLTFLLRDSLGGNTKTRMIACVHPDSRCFGETLSTLNFARSAKLIKNKAVVNEDFHGNNQKLQNEIRRLKELLESLQNSPGPEIRPSVVTPTGTVIPSVVTAPDTPSFMNADSVWKKNFIEAMYFREQSENEKKTLQDVVNHLQELCNKKDKYIQSTKMIIKFRENHIQSLQQASKGYTEMEKDLLVKSLRDEIKVLRQQLENNPMLAKYAGENKHLRSELKQLRARESLSNIHSDVSRSAQLERVFKELKLFKELSTGNSCGGLRSSPLKDGLSAATLDKHRREIKGYQEQLENVRQQLSDMTKAAENRQMEMEVELVSCRRMIVELERVLEAHQLKARIECNALKDLHCQTLKVMTTPKLSASSPNTQDQAVGDAPDSELGITDCILPKDLAEGAHDALMEEIRMLQMENGKLKERVDEYEADMLRQRQQVEKLELYNTQLNTVLEKERAENTARRNDYTSAVNTLKEEIDTVKNDLKLLNDENTDLHLVLKSADKQLKEEKENHKALHQAFTHEIETLEAKLSKTSIDLETTTRDYEEALKELGALKEDLETSSVTIAFLENHSIELEESRNREVKKREKIEQEYKALKSAGDINDYKEFKEQAEANLDYKEAELDVMMQQKAEQEKMIEQQEKLIEENKEIINNLMNKMHEMKTNLAGKEASNMNLKSEIENYKMEAEEAKRDQEKTSAQLAATLEKLEVMKQNYENSLDRKDFEISNLQEDQESANNTMLKQAEMLTNLQEQLELKELLCKERLATIEDYKNKLEEKEQVLQETIQRFKERLREANNSDENTDGIKKLLNQKNIELETLHVNYKKLGCMLQEYELTRKEKNEENELLKAQVVDLEKTKESLEKSRQEVEELQIAINTMKASNKDLIKTLESTLKDREAELKQEQAKSKEIDARLEHVIGEKERIEALYLASKKEEENSLEEVARLQSILDNHYTEKTELNSKIESLQEEKTKLKDELVMLKELNSQLVEESNRLIGHTNTNQKIRLFDKKNQEYNELAKKHCELQLEHRKLLQELKQPQCKITGTPTSKSTSSTGIRDITNVNHN